MQADTAHTRSRDPSQAQQHGRATAAQRLSHGGGLSPPAPRAVQNVRARAPQAPTRDLPDPQRSPREGPRTYLHRTTTWMFLPFSSFLGPPPREPKAAMAGRERSAAAEPELGWAARAAASAALNRAPPGPANQRRPRGTTGRISNPGGGARPSGGTAPPSAL